MIGREFTIDKKTFLKRKLTILQHKLRVVMKCYTVVNFKLYDSENKFEFQKCYRVNKIRIDDPTLNSGKYSIEEIPSTDNIVLKIFVD
jgi:hypothetical protein